MPRLINDGTLHCEACRIGTPSEPPAILSEPEAQPSIEALAAARRWYEEHLAAFWAGDIVTQLARFGDAFVAEIVRRSFGRED